jgi:hypothetical protein
MDNVNPHRGEADTVEDLLWHVTGPGRLPANVVPELNDLSSFSTFWRDGSGHFGTAKWLTMRQGRPRPDLPGLGSAFELFGDASDTADTSSSSQ